MSEAFGPDDAIKAWSRESYVENEAGSDEYRETQPWKLLSTIGGIADSMPGDPRADDLLELVKRWVAQAGSGYDGDHEARPLLAMIHDILWDSGEHVYLDSYAELVAEYREYRDD